MQQGPVQPSLRTRRHRTTLRGAAALMLAMAATWSGCQPSVPQNDTDPAPDSSQILHVAVILIDTLRADHLGCYGYSRNTSPFIDKLAREGVVFERAVAPSSYTRESVSALFMGRYPSANAYGTGWYATPDPNRAGLAGLFRQAGYQTALFTDTPVIAEPGFYAGFNEAQCVTDEYNVSGLGRKVAERALPFARKNAAVKTMTYTHYLDPHAPYTPPPEYYLRFAESLYPNPLPMYNDVRAHVPELMADGFGPGDPRFEDLLLRYDAEIALIDDTLREWFEALQAMGLDDKTLIVLMADHGEEFLEHNYVAHAWRLYWESVHVPLIFWAPGRLQPQRISHLVSLVDVLPTLLTMLDIHPSPEDLDGAPLFEPAGGGWIFREPPERPVISELMIQTRSLLRMVHQGDDNYMAAQKWLTAAECAQVAPNHKQLVKDFENGLRTPLDIWGPVVREELYDAAQDPGQKTDLLTVRPKLIPPLRQVLQRLRSKAPKPVDDRLRRLEGDEAALEALGYLGGASAKKKTSPPKNGEATPKDSAP